MSLLWSWGCFGSMLLQTCRSYGCYRYVAPTELEMCRSYGAGGVSVRCCYRRVAPMVATDMSLLRSWRCVAPMELGVLRFDVATDMSLLRSWRCVAPMELGVFRFDVAADVSLLWLLQICRSYGAGDVSLLWSWGVLVRCCCRRVAPMEVEPFNFKRRTKIAPWGRHVCS